MFLRCAAHIKHLECPNKMCSLLAVQLRFGSSRLLVYYRIVKQRIARAPQTTPRSCFGILYSWAVDQLKGEREEREREIAMLAGRCEELPESAVKSVHWPHGSKPRYSRAITGAA